jgi:hypothetical protein
MLSQQVLLVGRTQLKHLLMQQGLVKPAAGFQLNSEVQCMFLTQMGVCQTAYMEL